jgi:FkbM family methyltransferase
MSIILAELFRLLFKIDFFKKRYFGIHQRLFRPYNLFKGVIRKTGLHGFQMILHVDDWIQQNLYFLGEYEKAELKAIAQFLKEDGVFIDIGANIGLYTLYASQVTNKNARIISFEPFSENFKTLSQNIALNDLSNVRLEKIAIGEKDGMVNLYYDEQDKNLGMVSTKPLEKGLKEEVKVVTLDSYLKDKAIAKIDLIKIDIEGFEYSALLGMKNTLATFYPTLLIEILNHNVSSGQDSNCDSLLNDLGYKKYFIDDNGKLSENNVNLNRRNYIYTKQRLDNIS